MVVRAATAIAPGEEVGAHEARIIAPRAWHACEPQAACTRAHSCSDTHAHTHAHCRYASVTWAGPSSCLWAHARSSCGRTMGLCATAPGANWRGRTRTRWAGRVAAAGAGRLAAALQAQAAAVGSGWGGMWKCLQWGAGVRLRCCTHAQRAQRAQRPPGARALLPCSWARSCTRACGRRLCGCGPALKRPSREGTRRRWRQCRSGFRWVPLGLEATCTQTVGTNAHAHTCTHARTRTARASMPGQSTQPARAPLARAPRLPCSSCPSSSGAPCCPRPRAASSKPRYTSVLS